MRALMLAFDRWVRDGVEPPPNTYPRIADGTLVTIVGHAQAFPRIPDFRLPEGNLRPPRLDLGSRFETERIADEVPPTIGKPFETLVPKPDATGSMRAASRCRKCWCRSAPGPASTRATPPPAFLGLPGGGMAPSCRFRAPTWSSKRPAIRGRRFKRAMPTAPRRRPRCDLPPRAQEDDAEKDEARRSRRTIVCSGGNVLTASSFGSGGEIGRQLY
jgi:hypothetical protein